MHKKRAFLAIAIVPIMIIMAGCAGKGMKQDSCASAADNAYMEEAFPEPVPEAEMPEAAPAGTNMEGVYDRGGEAGLNYGNQKIITTYRMDMNTDEFDKHMAMLQEQALLLGGYIQSSDVNGTKPETYSDPGRYASFAFRIPTDKAQSFLDFVNGTGEITYRTCETENVTLSYYDLETRLEVLNTQLGRLKSILVKTDNLADIIELEQAIADVTLEIEQNTTQLRRYDDLIDYTTIYIGISENRLSTGPAARDTMGQRIKDGLTESIAGVGVFLENAAVGIICALPMMLLLAVIAVILVLIVKLIRKLTSKGREKRIEKAMARRKKMEALSDAKKDNKEK